MWSVTSSYHTRKVMITNVTQWLDSTAKKYPDKKAFCDENSEMTFTEVRENAFAIATKIIEAGLNREPIAVVIGKSVETLVAFMGVAYSGCFYTVIDTDMPESRVLKIMEVLEPRLVLTTIKDIDHVCKYQTVEQVICIDSIDPNPDIEEIVNRRREHIIDTDLLYCLFTSGSTGVPKGVTICHRSVIDYIDWVTDTFNIVAEDTFGNQSPFYFDNSVLDIYSCIKTGARLEIIPKLYFMNPKKLLEFVVGRNINTIFWVPSALVIVANLHALKKIDLSSTLKRILFAGEVMPAKQLNEWMKYVPAALYANLYGPTEITVDCTCYIVDRAFKDDEPIPIGKPTKNTDILVLNEKDQLVEGNEIGELCVRGTSLSMGYYGNASKTDEVFVQNPLNKKYPEKIYRTGDLVHYNSYGELIYVSRKDFQIKHRGHRIELGEIETAASALNKMQRCCCVYDNKKQRIVMFYQGSVDESEIKNELEKNLPDYMIPGKYISIKDMPLNANGKIDRKELQNRV